MGSIGRAITVVGRGGGGGGGGGGGETDGVCQEPKRLSDFLRESDDDDEEMLMMEIDLKSRELCNTACRADLGLNRLGRLLRLGRRRKTKMKEGEVMRKKKERGEKGDLVLQGFSQKLCNLSESKCEKGDTRRVKMDQMEAELEIELERMRCTFSEGSSSLEREDHKNQVPDEWIDLCEKLSSDWEQYDETWQDECGQSYGVSPYELERKLHELLHQRQQERIKELEFQLQFLKRKLLEKEIEIIQWKGIPSSVSSDCE